jgi:hypothetical protein
VASIIWQNEPKFFNHFKNGLPAGIEFIDENGGGPRVRLRKRQRAKKPK